MPLHDREVGERWGKVRAPFRGTNLAQWVAETFPALKREKRRHPVRSGGALISVVG